MANYQQHQQLHSAFSYSANPHIYSNLPSYPLMNNTNTPHHPSYPSQHYATHAQSFATSSPSCYPTSSIMYNSQMIASPYCYNASINNSSSNISSGYASINSSFSSPASTLARPSNLFARPTATNCSQFNEQPSYPSQPTKTKKSKRARDQETQEDTQSTTTDYILQQVFASADVNNELEPRPAKRKQTKKQAEPMLTVPVEQPKKTIPAASNYDDENCDGDDNNEFGDDNELADGYNQWDELSSASDASKRKRVLNRHQRVAANQRERKRMNIMNESFVQLRQALPISTGRKRRKMSRLDIVIGAMDYIAYLDSLLNSDSPFAIDFEAYQNSLYNY